MLTKKIWQLQEYARSMSVMLEATYTHEGRQTDDRHTCRHTHEQTDRLQVVRWTNLQIDRQTVRQAGRVLTRKACHPSCSIGP